MPDFEVRITTPTELEGAKRLAEQLEQNIGKAKALGESYEELEAKLKNVQEAIKNADVEPEHLEEHKHHARELREELHLLGSQLGPLGELLRHALHPEVAGVAALVAAIELIKQKFEDLNAVVEEFYELQTKLDLSKLNGMAESYKSAAESVHKLREDLEASQKAWDKGAVDREIESYNKIADAALRILEAREKTYQLQIKESNLPEDQKARLIEESEIRLAGAKGDTEMQKLRKELEVKEADLQKKESELNAYGATPEAREANIARQSRGTATNATAKAAEEAGEQLESAKNAKITYTPSGELFEGIGGVFGDVTINRDEAVKRLAKYREKADEDREFIENEEAAGFGAGWTKHDKAVGNLELLQKGMDSLQAAIEKHDAAVTTYQMRVDQTAAAHKADIDAVEKHSKAIVDLTADIEKLKAETDALRRNLNPSEPNSTAQVTAAQTKEEVVSAQAKELEEVKAELAKLAKEPSLTKDQEAEQGRLQRRQRDLENQINPPPPPPHRRAPTAADYGYGPRANTFGEHVETSIHQADQAISHAQSVHGQHGTVGVLTEKITELTSELHRALEMHDRSDVRRLEEEIEHLRNAVSTLGSRMSASRVP